jgi:hypothetical protein
MAGTIRRSMMDSTTRFDLLSSTALRARTHAPQFSGAGGMNDARAAPIATRGGALSSTGLGEGERSDTSDACSSLGVAALDASVITEAESGSWCPATSRWTISVTAGESPRATTISARGPRHPTVESTLAR